MGGVLHFRERYEIAMIVFFMPIRITRLAKGLIKRSQINNLWVIERWIQIQKMEDRILNINYSYQTANN